jgi:hypothetical protein
MRLLYPSQIREHTFLPRHVPAPQSVQVLTSPRKMANSQQPARERWERRGVRTVPLDLVDLSRIGV